MINKDDMIANRYLILDTLGEGGMSNVYLAEDTYLHRKVALKSLRTDLQNDQQIRLRFQRESRAMSKLSSPYIVNILDVGDEDIPFIVMEYVPGCSLKKYIKQNYPLPYQQVVNLMEEILKGVSVAHTNGIIHRDLKPQNVMITPDHHAKVADFGIALSQGEQSITQTNSTMGSVHYMAPERVRGQQASIQSDIYALGIILYEMLTNKLPFDGDTSLAIALKHFNEATPSLRRVHPDIPQALENVVFKATAKDSHQRYTSALAMADDLKTTLTSKRAHEPVFVALDSDTKPIGSDAEKTKVMAQLAGKGKNSAKNKPLKNPWYKKRLFWLLDLVIAILVITGLIWLNDRKEVSVPDVSNLSPAQARAVLNNSHLKAHISVNEHSNSVAKNNIIRSLPPRGAHLKSGSSVKLIRSLGPRKYSVPNLVGDNYYHARKKLIQKGFKVKRSNRYSSKIAAGTVIKQSPKSKKKVVFHKKMVRLTVSLGQKNYSFPLKDLTGYNLRGAQDYANEEGLQLIVKNIASNSMDKGIVISQAPVAGTKVLRGSTLTVNISSGKLNTNETSSNTNEFNNDMSNNPVQTVTRVLNIPFNDQDNLTSNQVQIYIKDAAHNLNEVYRTMNIDSSTQVTVPFQLSKGQVGQYRIVNDGKVVETGNVTAG